MNRTCTLIVSYNGAPWLRRCLDSLRASACPGHVMVVDNASTDDTLRIVEAEYPEVERVRLASNLGFGGGNNVGIARAIAAGHEYIFLLNQDAYVTPDALGAMTRFMDSHPAFGVVSPLHCSPTPASVDRKTLVAYLQKHAPAYLSDACLGTVQPHYAMRGINAAAWFVRSSVFQRVGGFDPLFFMYGEDDDLINRFADHGVGFALLPSAVIVHLRESVVSPTPTRRVRIEKLAQRKGPALLVDIKRPGFSRLHMCTHLVARGMFLPLADFVVERKLDELCASVLAAAALVRQLNRIHEHAALCASVGAHFLQVPLIAPPGGTTGPVQR